MSFIWLHNCCCGGNVASGPLTNATLMGSFLSGCFLSGLVPLKMGVVKGGPAKGGSPSLRPDEGASSSVSLTASTVMIGSLESCRRIGRWVSRVVVLHHLRHVHPPAAEGARWTICWVSSHRLWLPSPSTNSWLGPPLEFYLCVCMAINSIVTIYEWGPAISYRWGTFWVLCEWFSPLICA